MIEGFEDITEELNDYEKKVMNILVFNFKKFYVGEHKAVTNKRIQEGMLNCFHIPIDGARIRKIISHIRCSGQIPNLMASSKGYYIEPDAEKLKSYVQSLRSRANSILLVAESIEKYYGKGSAM